MRKKDKIGVWIIGVGGHLATTLMVGTRAVARKLVNTTGMVTELPLFYDIDFIDVDDLVFGGVDIRPTDVKGNAWSIYEKTGIFSYELIKCLEHDLDSISSNTCLGTPLNCGDAVTRLAQVGLAEKKEDLSHTIHRIREQLISFAREHKLSKVIVVNLASTEPVLELVKEHNTYDGLKKLIKENRMDKITASTLYAYAAIEAGFPYINFTPSNGALIPAIIELADEVKVPVMGCDGKTGETLVKTALAPLFAYRNLRVLSWQGYNILGNRDGQVLNDPRNKQTKVKSKGGVLGEILGYEPHAHVGIDYVPSLDDWKTAWDFIHFEGFLGTKMSMQFTWQGCDSVLAAPLVLDIVRLTEIASRLGEYGLMPQLAFFFKSPIGVREHNLSYQFQSLVKYLEEVREKIRNKKLERIEKYGVEKRSKILCGGDVCISCYGSSYREPGC